MSTFKNLDCYGYLRIDGNLYSNVNSSIYGNIYGIPDFHFNGYDLAYKDWISYDIQHPQGHDINNDSWKIIQSSAANAWGRGLHSKKKFRRYNGLTLEFEAYLAASDNVMIGFIDSMSESFNYNQTPSDLIYLVNNNVEIYINGSSQNYNYNFNTGNSAWHKYKIVLNNDGSCFYVDNNLIGVNKENSNKYLKILIDCYNASKTFYFKNFKVYMNYSYNGLVNEGNLIIVGDNYNFSVINSYNITWTSIYFSLTSFRYFCATSSNGSGQRGIHGSGMNSAWSSIINVIDYTTINIVSVSTDFGDMSYYNTYGAGGLSNRTNNRMVISGGYNSGPLSVMQYITINSPGNSSNFGSLTQSRYQPASCSNAENNRGLNSGGSQAGTTPQYNTIDYITISSAGNATDFGDLTRTSAGPCSFSNGTSNRGIIAGGNDTTYTVLLDIINYVTITTPGNAASFGTLFNKNTNISAESNSEGNNGIFAGGVYFGVNSCVSSINISSTGNSNLNGYLSSNPNYGAMSNS